MKFKVLMAVLTSSLLVLGACGDSKNTAAGGYAVRAAPATINIMFHSSNAYGNEDVGATENMWHAFFEAPATPTVARTITTDLSLLNGFHVLYISQGSIDSLSPADMATVRDWTNAGGILLLNYTSNDDIASAFGTFLGASYVFTSADELNGETAVVTDAGHRLLTVPNVLDSAALSNWNSTSHGVFSVVGSAYTCVVDDSDGLSSLPTLCATPYGLGAIVITAIDPECGCHDDHLIAGTRSGSELLENFLGIIYNL
jgi:hypothetical protein